MKEQKEYPWFSLLKYFEKMKYIQNGLTIPFLIGATKLHTGISLTVSEIITEMMNEESNSKVSIFKCGTIKEYVIGTVDIESEMMYNKYAKNLGNMIPIDASLTEFNNSKKMISQMAGLYQDIINNKTYSKNKGQWTVFTKEDNRRIVEFKQTQDR